MVAATIDICKFELKGWEMTDESTEQKRQKIIDSFEREQRYFEKVFEENAERLNIATKANNLAGIDQARKNMGEASEILGDLVKGKNEALSELQAAENAAQAVTEETLSQDTAPSVNEEQEEKQEKSEEEDYYYGYGM
jgi:NADH dehydrogenase/NADH:ubiquinone oxidoreductase subunit G